MYILLTALKQEAVVTLEEPDDCNRFHVAINGLSENVARQALVSEQVGQFVSREAAGIKIVALRRLAGGRVGPDWSTRFENMLRFAESKGWLNTDRTEVRGHCEWSENPDV
jgi:hypothetical protein